MKIIHILGQDIPYVIIKKKNKNTYFRFKKEGFIQITLSKYQSEKEALDFIKNNSHSFLNKWNSIPKKVQDPNLYYYLGKAYKINESTSHKPGYIEEDTISFPVDHRQDFIRKFEKEQVLNIAYSLLEKHKNNPIVSLDHIQIKTRYASSRYGSCNPIKRTINLSTHLIHAPLEHIEYVFLHEISHLKHPNHSQAFYDTLGLLCPNHKTYKQELRQFI